MILRNYTSLVCALFIGFSLCSCNEIYTGEQLSSTELAHIKSLGLLDNDEKIYQFCSNNGGVKKAGNFYTTKRIARYWWGDCDRQKYFTYYRDVARLKLTLHPPGDFTIPFMTVINKDSTQFKVYINSNKADVNTFFLNCQAHWEAGQ